MGILIAITALVIMTPFGGQATQPFIFLVYRTLLFSVTLACFWKSRQESGPDFHPGFYVATGAILGTMLLSVWTSAGSRADGYALWYQHLVWAAFFVAVARFSARQSLQWKSLMLASVIGAGLLHLAIGLVVGEPLTGAFLNGNYLGSYMLIGFAASIAVLLFHKNVYWRVGTMVTAPLLFYGITETVSRGATLAAVGVALVGLWQLRRWAVVGGALAAAAIVLVLIGLANPELVTKFTDQGEVNPYNYSRTQIWMSTFDMIAEQPVLGVGPARYQHVARRFRFPVEDTIGRFMKRQSIAHSEYLHYAAESGIPMALLLIGLIVYFARVLGQARAASPVLFLEQAALLAIVGVGIHAAVDNNFQVPVVLALLATLSLASAPLTRSTPIRFPVSTRGMAGLGVLIVALYFDSTLIPGVAYHYNDVGNQEQMAQRFGEAELDHRFAVSLRPTDSVLLTNLGVTHKLLYLQTGDPHMLDVADAFFTRAAEANPFYLQARQERADTLVLRLTGNTGRDLKVHRRLIEANQAVLELDPFLPFIRKNLAEAFYRSGNRAKAYEELLKTVELEPNYVPGFTKLAEWYQADGNVERSRAFLDRAGSIELTYSAVTDVTDYEAIILGRPAGSPGS